MLDGVVVFPGPKTFRWSRKKRYAVLGSKLWLEIANILSKKISKGMDNVIAVKRVEESGAKVDRVYCFTVGDVEVCLFPAVCNAVKKSIVVFEGDSDTVLDMAPFLVKC